SWAHPHAVKAGNAAMVQVGDEVVVWDYKTGKVRQEEHLDKSPLEVRWLHGAAARGGFINCAFGNSLWYWEVGKDGKLTFTRVVKLADGSIPADMRISYDNRFLFVSLFGGGAVQQYDVEEPLHPKLVSTVSIPQAQMLKLTPDNKRLYVSNSLLSNLDGKVPYAVRLVNVTPTGPAFLSDLDGTLVDSVYQHVLAWREALESAGIELSVWRIHRRIGMSGGLFVNALFRETGRDLKPEQAAKIRQVHRDAYARMGHQIRPLPGARELLAYLTKIGVPWAIGTSGRMESAKPTLDMLDIPAGVPIITRDQVEYAKPDPDLFVAGAGRLGVQVEDAVVVGDSVWDLLAARR